MIKRLLFACLLAFPFTPAVKAATTAQSTYSNKNEIRFDDPLWVLNGNRYKKYSHLIKILEDGFNILCADTFCGGSFTDMSTVRLSCAMETQSEKLSGCLWVIAAIEHHINANTGETQVTNRTMFECKIPVEAKLDIFIEALLRAQDGDPEQTYFSGMIPGLGKSFHAYLTDCIYR